MNLNTKVYFPKEFIDKYEKILGKIENKNFLESCSIKLTKAIRINKLKVDSITEIDILKDLELEEISYLKGTYLIKSKVSAIGNTIEQLTGQFQIQEVSSLLPVIILDPKPGEVVLDLTAAPGNKTSYIAEKMNNTGLIVANEIDNKRIKILIYTLKKLGVTNTIITNFDGRKLDLGLKFDKILLDAPCSCEGEIKKKTDVLKNWNEKLVLSKSKLQKELITNAFNLLKTGGTLVYSTCTHSPEENEEVIDYLIKKQKNILIEKIEIPKLLTKNGLLEYNSKKYNQQIENSIRIWPQHTNLEGFFICKIKKL
ncbi:MAG: RsmB/NOP family class I SAM-dependent RNA methyltransferase [Candidatus ainarchaeum sp.]|nr:RsmB/NOP family class I SAM-dependent RNA methyltransferase [Candidatus ainarchaeum sp.]